MWRSVREGLRKLLGRRAGQEAADASELARARKGRPAAGERRRPAPEALDLHLGIDFGTRYTKVCFRDLGRDRSEVVTFSPLNLVQLDKALLPSRLEVREGLLYGGLTEGEWRQVRRNASKANMGIEFVKIRLAQLDVKEIGDDWPFAEVEGSSDPEAIEALTAFYLARVIDRSRKWIGEERRELLLGRRPQWSVSLGVPVQYCDSPALARFKRVLGVATAWADAGVGTTIPSRELKNVAESLSGIEPETGFDVVPELMAGVRSFIASPQAPEGVYVYMDVGSATLDGVSFRYLRQGGRVRLVCHSAKVQPFGVSAVAARLAPAAGVSLEEIERVLSGEGTIDGPLGAMLEESRGHIRRLVAGILLEGKQRDRAGWSAGVEQVARKFYRSVEARRFPFFVGGGGSLSHFYRQTIEGTHSAHRLEGANIRGYMLEKVPSPQDLALHGLPPSHFHRFAVAYGLSIPPGESGDLDLPSTVPPEPPRKPRPPDTRRYEDTKEIT